ncbi:MAG: hypothetical protein ACQEWL_21115 [Pseudomonadota bacterium]|uniref:hypothetical protein n=1 Tax=Providencia TaxID=586 RepID=UPI0024B08083
MFSFLSFNAVKKIPILLWLIGLLGMTSIAQAKNVIIIPKGEGIVWQGKPFTSKLLKINNSSYGYLDFGGRLRPLITATTNLGTSAYTISCPLYSTNPKPGDFTKVAGYDAMMVIPGLYLAIVGNFWGEYTDQTSYQRVSFNGAFGNNKFITSNAPKNAPKLTIINDGVNCVSLAGLTPLIKRDTDYQVQMSGYWVLIADGTQKTATTAFVSALVLNAPSGAGLSTNADTNLFPRDTEFKISTLECNINTPPTINFGDVLYSNQAGKELANKMTTIETYCSQGDEVIDSNINLTFRAISGYFENDTSKLSLKEGGGYITGQIERTQQSFDGSCGLTGRGIPFDNSTQITLGKITQTQPSASFMNPVLWRLCAGGDGKLPYGKVTASAEVTVTLN